MQKSDFGLKDFVTTLRKKGFGHKYTGRPGLMMRRVENGLDDLRVFHQKVKELDPFPEIDNPAQKNLLKKIRSAVIDFLEGQIRIPKVTANDMAKFLSPENIYSIVGAKLEQDFATSVATK